MLPAARIGAPKAKAEPMAKIRVYELKFSPKGFAWKESKAGPQVSLALEWEGQRLDKYATAFASISTMLLGIEFAPVLDEDGGPVFDVVPAGLEVWKGVGYLEKRSLDPPAAKTSVRVMDTDDANAGRIESLIALRLRMQRKRIEFASVKLQLWQEGLFDEE